MTISPKRNKKLNTHIIHASSNVPNVSMLEPDVDKLTQSPSKKVIQVEGLRNLMHV